MGGISSKELEDELDSRQFATKSDLEHSKECTMIAKGVEWCSASQNNSTVNYDTRVKTLLDKNKEEPVCISMISEFDIAGKSPEDALPFIGDGKFPEHFLCFEQGSINKYSDAFVNRQARDAVISQMPELKLSELKSMKDLGFP